MLISLLTYLIDYFFVSVLFACIFHFCFCVFVWGGVVADFFLGGGGQVSLTSGLGNHYTVARA